MDPADGRGRGSDQVRGLTPTQRKTPTWLRILAGILAIGTLVWLQLEDPSYTNSLIIASLITLIGMAVLLARSATDPCRRPWVRFPLISLAMGFVVPILATFLMLFKSGLHGHGFPEYALSDYVDVLQLIPICLAIALVVGLGLAGWHWNQCRAKSVQTGRGPDM